MRQTDMRKVLKEFRSWANATCGTCGESFVEETDEEVLHLLRIHTCTSSAAVS